MIRPATPLTILFLVAFALLLIATLSAPIIKGIPIATVNGNHLGVFGYCTPTVCSKIQIGYTVDPKILFGNGKPDFALSASTRSSLSYILVIHPVAALLALAGSGMAGAAHLHGPAHSSQYMIGIVGLAIPTFLLSLLALLVDVLLFYPHNALATWLTIAATLFILAAGVMTCVMRRTIISREDRKARVAENAEMNGENFYARQNAVPQGIRADSPPPMASGALGPADNKLPSFATFDKGAAAEEDRVPLQNRTPSNKTLPGRPSEQGRSRSDENGARYGQPPGYGARGGPGSRGGYPGPNGRGGYPGRGGPGGFDGYRDRPPGASGYGPEPPMGYRRDRSEPPMRRPYPGEEGMQGHGYRGRGRGGYPPRGYGRGAPYGPGRGGYGRGGAGPPYRGMPPSPDQGYGYPPDRSGWNDDRDPGPAGYGRSPSAPGYGRRQQSPGRPPPPGADGYDRGPPYRDDDYGRARQHSDPYGSAPGPGGPQAYNAIGQAIEMNDRSGSGPAHGSFDERNQQPLQQDPGVGQQAVNGAVDTDQYVPARAAWNDSSPNPRSAGGPTGVTSPSQEAAVELPSQPPMIASANRSHSRKQSADNYYEDVDPRFAPPPLAIPPQNPHASSTLQTPSSAAMPTSLMPGLASPTSPAGNQAPRSYNNAHPVPPISVPPNHHNNNNASYDDMPDGARSPASDHSNMTSISQRGVNPHWQPPPSSHPAAARRPPNAQQQQRRDLVLDTNPDFNLGGPRSANSPQNRRPF